MEDKIFCIEYVKRIARPAKTKTSIQMIGIVEKGIEYNKNDMFSDEAMKVLGKNSVEIFVHGFIRDNQSLFLSENKKKVSSENLKM